MLTKAGWPRPRNSQGLPVPWISPAEALAIKNAVRQKKVAKGKHCQVCGDRVRNRVFCFVQVEVGPGDPAPIGVPFPPDAGVHAMDHGLLHRRCARLALAHCPELKRLRQAGSLRCASVPAGNIEAFGGHVYLVDMDTL